MAHGFLSVERRTDLRQRLCELEIAVEPFVDLAIGVRKASSPLHLSPFSALPSQFSPSTVSPPMRALSVRMTLSKIVPDTFFAHTFSFGVTYISD
jgi:hypothetical protein